MFYIGIALIILTIIGSVGLAICTTYGTDSKQNEVMSKIAVIWIVILLITLILHLFKFI